MRRGRIVLLALVLLMATSLLSGCLGTGGYVISGRVSDTAGNGLSGVKLVISGGTTATVVTTADGKWKANVKGTVKVTPEPQEGYLFSPLERTAITKATSNLDFERFSNKILWYIFPEGEHFDGAMTIIPPPDILVGIKYDIVVEENELTELPPGYDVLVLSDIGAEFDVGEFEGRIIVTIDSSVSPLMFWMTGDIQDEEYWDYGTGKELTWTKPITGTELGAHGDARVYTFLDGEFGFTRRHDLIQASSTEDADDVILYQIKNEKGSWWWLHVGPHFGDYDEEDYVPRAWEIIHYTLDLINGYEPEFPPLPVEDLGGMSLIDPAGRN